MMGVMLYDAHHQPEALHAKSSAIHKLGPADYPIYWGQSRHVPDTAKCPLPSISFTMRRQR